MDLRIHGFRPGLNGYIHGLFILLYILIFHPSWMWSGGRVVIVSSYVRLSKNSAHLFALVMRRRGRVVYGKN